MDWKIFNKKLNKISVLADNAFQDNSISSLERDLMASYVRDLYDMILEDGLVGSSKKNISEFQNFNTGNQSRQEKKETHITPTAKPTVTYETYEREVAVEEKVLELVPEVAVLEITQPKEQVSQVSQVATISVPQPASKAKQLDDNLMNELFVDDKISDLSGKLGSQKIPDLTKAMGINERIFTVQELFNNDQNFFNTVLHQLNSMNNFDEAKNYLIEEVITKLDWTAENKLKKAGTFIKLVKRRYV